MPSARFRQICRGTLQLAMDELRTDSERLFVNDLLIFEIIPAEGKVPQLQGMLFAFFWTAHSENFAIGRYHRTEKCRGLEGFRDVTHALFPSRFRKCGGKTGKIRSSPIESGEYVPSLCRGLTDGPLSFMMLTSQ